MKQIAVAVQLLALASLFSFTTNPSFAYPHKLDVHFGGNFLRQPAPSAGQYFQGYRPFGADAVTPTGGNCRDYICDISQDGIYTWEANKLPIKIFISNGAGVPGYRPQFGGYIRQSFDEWCQASGNKIAWVEVRDANQADVTVNWTDNVFERPEGTEAGKTAALTRLNTATGRGIIYGARMQMLTRLPGREFGDAEVAKTCLHEAGHAVGLQGHSKVRTDIMYYAVSPSQVFELSPRDRATISRLYAAFPTRSDIAVEAKN